MGTEVDESARGLRRTRTAAARRAATVSLPFALVLVWLVMEYARPSVTFRLPMITSLGLLAWWVSTGGFRWPPQLKLGFALLLEMLVSVPIAANGYSAFWITYTMAINIACIMAGIAFSIDNLRRTSIAIATIRSIFLYVGTFAVFHGGLGPAGSAGAQDENYVGMMMAMAIPLAYFPMLHARTMFYRISYFLMIAVYVSALVVGFSRGAFVGLCAVGLYCIWRSPHRLAALVTVIIAVGVASQLLPKGYWQEMKTTTNPEEATADLRLQAWGIAVREFADHPIIGVGPGNYKWNMEPYVSEESMDKLGRSLAGSMVTHSLYFELLADLGIVGTILVASIIFTTLRGLNRTRVSCLMAVTRSPHNRRSSQALDSLNECATLADAVLASLIGFFVCSVFVSTLYQTYLWVWVGIALGINTSLISLRGRTSMQRSRLLRTPVE